MKTGSEAARHDVCTRGKQPYYQDKEHNRDIRYGHGDNGSGDEGVLKARGEGRAARQYPRGAAEVVHHHGGSRKEGICLAAV